MGLVCDPDHPLFKGFPTESHSNFSSNHKFGAIFASRVGDAKLPVCGLDLKELAKTPDPAIRHIRNSLLS